MMKTDINNKITVRTILVAAAFLYAHLVVAVYKYVISPVCYEPVFYGIRCYPYHDLETWLFSMLVLMAVLPAFWMPVAITRPSQILYWLFYVIVMVPSMIFPFYDVGVPTAKLLLHNAVLLIAFLLLGGIYRLPTVHIPRKEVPKKWFWTAVVLFSMYFYIYIVFHSGLRFKVVSLEKVSEVRAAYKDILKTTGKLFDIAMGWQANIINQFLIVIGLIDKRIWLILLGFLGQLAIYAVAGFKSYLFSVLLVVAISLLLSSNDKNYGKNFGFYMFSGIISMILVAVVVDAATDALFRWLNPLVTSLFVRRIIVLQGLLSGYYYEFFSQNPKALLGHNILKGIVPYPYDLPVPNLIGNIYFGNSATHANVNFMLDSYANFGYGGVFLSVIFLGFLLWLFDSIAREKDIRLSTLILAAPAFTITGSPLIASFIYSILPALLIVYLMPEKILRSDEPLSLIKQLRKVFRLH